MNADGVSGAPERPLSVIERAVDQGIAGLGAEAVVSRPRSMRRLLII
jgi:hypothetical protein